MFTRRICAIPFAVIALYAGPTASAKDMNHGALLWHGVRVGMSLADIQKVLPGSTLDKNGKTVVGGKTQVAGASFNSFVDLLNGGASRVTLIGSGYATDDVKNALNTKYGRATTGYACSSAGSLQVCAGAWSMAGGVKISLSRLTSVTGSALTITYEAVDLSGL